MPAEFSVQLMQSKYGITQLMYLNSAGKLAVRPPGLFDTPGAVCMAGMTTALVGLAFSLRKMAWWKRALSLLAAGVGSIIVYLSQVRTSLLVLMGMIAAYVIIVALVRKQPMRAVAILALGASVLSVAILSSSPLIGTAAANRFDSLTQGDPLSVYYQAGRGTQMESALTSLVPSYPLGAGLGRWGMMRVYFGDETNADSPQIWAELQIPAWVLDGGVILILLYGAALIVTCVFELRVAWGATGEVLQFCAPLIVAANLGTMAWVFGSTPFNSPLGMQYWFLAGALCGVAKKAGLFDHERLRAGKRGLHRLGRNGSGELRAGPPPS
jgi:hypothetical protein